jgi:hypothetical protein
LAGSTRLERDWYVKTYEEGFGFLCLLTIFGPFNAIFGFYVPVRLFMDKKKEKLKNLKVEIRMEESTLL